MGVRSGLVVGVVLAVVSAGPCRADEPAVGRARNPAGIAARYPGDVGIAKDPAVLLHEDFEAGQIDRRKWTDISNRAGALKLVRQRAHVHSGRQALQITATITKNTGGHLFRRFKRGVEKMHARFCVKFAPDIDYIHHFVHMVAELPARPWPSGGAGSRPAGDKKFSVAIDLHGHWGRYPPPGGWEFYCYFWKMPRSRDGRFWGRGFAPKPYAVPKPGRWYCVEFMVKCNTPGKPDGEVALWIDGKQLAHHKGINWRSSPKLKLNALWLMLYVTRFSAKRKEVNTVWFDDVVVATDYIGPPVAARKGPARPHGAAPERRATTPGGGPRQASPGGGR